MIITNPDSSKVTISQNPLNPKEISFTLNNINENEDITITATIDNVTASFTILARLFKMSWTDNYSSATDLFNSSISKQLRVTVTPSNYDVSDLQFSTNLSSYITLTQQSNKKYVNINVQGINDTTLTGTISASLEGVTISTPVTFKNEMHFEPQSIRVQGKTLNNTASLYTTPVNLDLSSITYSLTNTAGQINNFVMSFQPSVTNPHTVTVTGSTTDDYVMASSHLSHPQVESGGNVADLTYYLNSTMFDTINWRSSSITLRSSNNFTASAILRFNVFNNYKDDPAVMNYITNLSNYLTCSENLLEQGVMTSLTNVSHTEGNVPYDATIEFKIPNPSTATGTATCTIETGFSTNLNINVIV